MKELGGHLFNLLTKFLKSLDELYNENQLKKHYD